MSDETKKMNFPKPKLTHEKISIERNNSLALTGAFFAILLVLLSIDDLSKPLLVSLYASSIGAPILIFMSILNGLFIHLDKPYFDACERMYESGRYGVLSLLGYGSFLVAFLAIIYHLSPTAGSISSVITAYLLGATVDIMRTVGKIVYPDKEN